MKVVVTIALEVDVQRFYETQPLEGDECTPENVRSMIDSEFDNDLSMHPMVGCGAIKDWEVRR